MQIISRAKLLATLTGPVFAPNGFDLQAFTDIANAVLAHAPPEVQWFVYSDHENGGDFYVGIDPQLHSVETMVTQEILPMTYNSNGDSYHGVAVSYDCTGLGFPNLVYNCYLGGSSLNSACGFVLASAKLAD